MEKQMKHSLCGGTATLKVEDLKLKKSKITITGAHYYKCTKCGEEYSTSEQMRELDMKIKELRKVATKAHA